MSRMPADRDSDRRQVLFDRYRLLLAINGQAHEFGGAVATCGAAGHAAIDLGAAAKEWDIQHLISSLALSHQLDSILAVDALISSKSEVVYAISPRSDSILRVNRVNRH
jgi:hypothetical protein